MVVIQADGAWQQSRQQVHLMSPLLRGEQSLLWQGSSLRSMFSGKSLLGLLQPLDSCGTQPADFPASPQEPRDLLCCKLRRRQVDS